MPCNLRWKLVDSRKRSKTEKEELGDCFQNLTSDNDKKLQIRAVTGSEVLQMQSVCQTEGIEGMLSGVIPQ